MPKDYAMTPLEQLATLGKQYRVVTEDAYFGDNGDATRADDPWLQIIPCQRGHIYPHGGNLLAVATATRGGTAKAIRAIPGVDVLQDGDDGINASFPVELFPQVAELMKPHRRRQFTQEERDRLAELGRAHHFKPRHGAKTSETEQETARTAGAV